MCWWMGMSSESLSEHQRLSLAAIVQYYLIRNRKKGSRVYQRDLADEAGLDVQKVNNFVNAASKEGAPELRRYFEDLVRKSDGWFADPPDHINVAINLVYSPNKVADGKIKAE